jgi:hypothetical protein
MEQSARAGRRLGSLAISRLAGRAKADVGDLIPITKQKFDWQPLRGIGADK